MAFLCAICAHGGHLACYRAYYAVRPPIALVRAPSPEDGDNGEHQDGDDSHAHQHRSLSRTSTGTLVDDALAETVRPEQMLATRDREREREQQGPLARALVGHACAVGCGHVCWVSNEHEEA
jgi:hypothetical protein